MSYGQIVIHGGNLIKPKPLRSKSHPPSEP